MLSNFRYRYKIIRFRNQIERLNAIQFLIITENASFLTLFCILQGH